MSSIYTPTSVLSTVTHCIPYVLFISLVTRSNASTSVTSLSVNVTSITAYKCSAPFVNNIVLFWGESCYFCFIPGL